MSKNNFFKQFLSAKSEVGAVAPSSPSLRRKMLKRIDFSTAQVIIELGPGTGVFTRKILEKMAPDAKLFVFETNQHFYDLLSKSVKDDRAILLNKSAADIKDILLQYGIESVDYIVSSLPLAVIPKEIGDKIVSSSFEILKKEGIYIQFQYSLNAHKKLKERFNKVKLGFTPVNIPPAFVYYCYK